MEEHNAIRKTVDSTNFSILAADARVFENANTISKWLLSQPQDDRPRLAEAVFRKLLQEASQSRQYHGNGHACVKLCSFVQQCAKSNDQGLKLWAFTESLSAALFHFYLEWYEQDSHRALRLVLDVLVMSASSNPSSETGRTVRDCILETLVSVVARKSSQRLTKSGLQCLDYFLNKRVFTLPDIVSKYREVEPSVADVSTLSLWKSFAFHLFSWMELAYVCPLAGKCLVHIFRGLNAADPGAATTADSTAFTLHVWRQWLKEALARTPEILDDIRHYVLAPIFKTERDASLRLLEMSNQSQPLPFISDGLSDHGILLELAILELGKKYGLVQEPSSAEDKPQHQRAKSIVLQGALLDRLLAHPSASVRCSAFSLLVSSQETTRPFSKVAFELLKSHVGAFHADYDAKVRNEVLGHTKNLIKRTKNVITVAQRSLAAQRAAEDGMRPAVPKKFGPEVALRDAAQAREVLDQHEEFLGWYLGFLKGELVPTASYQRHITAVRAAILVLRVGKHAGATEETIDGDVARLISSDYTWIRVLLDLLLDPFDDVRDGAATLLGLLSPSSVAAGTPESSAFLALLRKSCTRAGKLADRTGRADHSDGAARYQGLLCRWLDSQDSQVALLSEILERVEAKISKAEEDLGHAALESPVHADFAAISYVWQVLAKQRYPTDRLEVLHHLQRRMFFCARQTWLTVKHVLCDDSPEGHLPEELEDIEGLDTKDLLSYSFRAVHESSNLLRLLVGTLRLNKVSGVPYPPLDVFRETGYLAFEQLASLRHRGAFSTVSYTFTTCCQLTQSLAGIYVGMDDSENLLFEWYQGALSCIMTQASTTRRSAGIPSLIAAVLSANADSPSFKDVYATLESIAKKRVRVSETDGSNLPQVHALNSLREVFRSSLLSKKAEGYLARTLHLAATSLKSEVWAIRNCGLLLLRSLIDCLLGTGDSKASIESGWDGHSVRISYSKYPTLPGVILGLLRSAGETMHDVSQAGAAEAVFPALDIIRRAGPPEEYRTELQKHIEGYLGSRLWHVREMAARTLCSFLLQADWANEISRLLAESGTNTNRLHGILLTVKFVIERKADLGLDLHPASPVDGLLDELSRRQDDFRRCPEVQAAYLEIAYLLPSPGCHERAARAPELATEKTGSCALLSLQSSLKVVYDTAARADVEALRSHLIITLNNDVDRSSRMIEVVPEAWKQVDDPRVRSGLCRLYLEVCGVSAAPEVRTRALVNFGLMMDDILGRREIEGLPSVDDLDRLWRQLQNASTNPALSCAITQVSGTIIAALLTNENKPPNVNQRLRSWGDMLGECLDVDNSFDTRYAAATALQSFFVRAGRHVWHTSYLPALFALYDALVDDDDEVREVAASAASAVTGTYAVAPAAADQLLLWMRDQQFAKSGEFAARVVCRMTGQQYLDLGGDFQLFPAEQQLRAAMDFDDSLFAAEEQNLFIDEVRETARWKGVLEGMIATTDGGAWSSPFARLQAWVRDGLECLIGLLQREDGPLGWTADQHVFAVCARILLGAVAVTKSGEGGRIVELLGTFRETAEKPRIHGSLLEMAR